MIDLLATLIVYQHANCLEYEAIFLTNRRLSSRIQDSYTSEHSCNITSVLGSQIIIIAQYILNDNVSDYTSPLKQNYKSCLLCTSLNLMISYFFICNLKYPHEGFNINSYISFASGDSYSCSSQPQITT